MATVCFNQNPNIRNTKLRDLGLLGSGVKFFVSSAVFGIVYPDLPIQCATFMGLR